MKYTINNKSYYLETNLVDKDLFTIDVLKEYYHERWEIEEYFEYMQNLFTKEYNKKKNNKYVLNKTLLTNGFINSNFLYDISVNIESIFSIFKNAYIKFTHTQKGKKNKKPK